MSEIELTAYNNGLIVFAGLTCLIAILIFVYYSSKNKGGK